MCRDELFESLSFSGGINVKLRTTPDIARVGVSGGGSCGSKGANLVRSETTPGGLTIVQIGGLVECVELRMSERAFVLIIYTCCNFS